jgi:rhodanese-related sulfurtransferase
METGLETTILNQFKWEILESRDLCWLDTRDALLSKVISNKMKSNNIATVCTGGSVRSPIFARALLEAGGNVATPNGQFYYNLIRLAGNSTAKEKSGGLLLPSISKDPINTLVCHADLGQYQGSESYSINRLLYAIGDVINEKSEGFCIKILNGDERFYRYV